MSYSVEITDRATGLKKTFTGDTQAQALEHAFDWARQGSIYIAAKELLEQLADARPMLEECNISGHTKEAFHALEAALL